MESSLAFVAMIGNIVDPYILKIDMPAKQHTRDQNIRIIKAETIWVKNTAEQDRVAQSIIGQSRA